MGRATSTAQRTCGLTDPASDQPVLPRAELVGGSVGLTLDAGDLPPSAAGQGALNAAQVLGGKATAPATLRATKAHWTHYAAWCAMHGFVPVPAASVTVGATLASMAESHAPTTVRRRLAAIGKMHRFNDLPWNAGHRDIAGCSADCCGCTGAHSTRPPR